MSARMLSDAEEELRREGQSPRSRAGSRAESFVLGEESVRQSVLGKLHRQGTTTLMLGVEEAEDDKGTTPPIPTAGSSWVQLVL